MVWDARHTLFPTLAPIIDQGISKAKELLPMITPLTKKLQAAITSDH